MSAQRIKRHRGRRLFFLLVLALVLSPQRTSTRAQSDSQPPEGAVDLGTGLYVREDDDLVVEDTPSIRFTRTYRNADSRSRAFGIGTNHPYNAFLVGDNTAFSWAALITADGGSIHYVRISPGSTLASAVFEHTATPSEFYKSRLTWNGRAWEIILRDGSRYWFSAYTGKESGRCGMIGYRDSQGRALGMRCDGAGNLISISTPNRRGIKLTYDASNRITRARTHFGRVVHVVNYEYDARGRLIKVRRIYVDIVGVLIQLVARLFGLPVPDEIARYDETMEYAYDDLHQMVRIREPGIVITNRYRDDRVVKQMLGNGETFKFDYVLNSQRSIIQTDVTREDGSVRRVTFNADGYAVSDTYALGTSRQRAIIYTRQAGSNRVLMVTLMCSPTRPPMKITAPLTPGERLDEADPQWLQRCE